jgi:hypothetical protein
LFLKKPPPVEPTALSLRIPRIGCTFAGRPRYLYDVVIGIALRKNRGAFA